MAPLTLEHWVIVVLAFLLGLFLGMYFFAGTKWKRRYTEEARLRAEERTAHERALSDSKHVEAQRIAAEARRP